ncbi:uncharacterized protein LOC106521487 [Austrofundulus limnaeus]|uniref:Uncharacterized protein LOC106521487 n=1 Tax=Austrofundulus limnaeus TaxID=52670 RepID=A0A2I4BP47_AUSLI|nr:PREDICTED: uncharacterized protein LOC106521487 [Austrofundulus limnaeus]
MSVKPTCLQKERPSWWARKAEVGCRRGSSFLCLFSSNHGPSLRYCRLQQRCRSWGRETVHFFLIPKVVKHQGEAAEELSAKRRDLWLARINRKDFIPSKDARVCSDHFKSGKSAALFDHSNPDWAPSLNLGYDTSADSARENSSKRLRSVRVQGKRQKKNQCEATAVLPEQTTNATPPQLPEQSSSHCTFSVTGTLEGVADEEKDGDGASSELQLGNQMRVEFQGMMSKIRNLEDSLTAATITAQSFESNVEKVKYYTGLPSFATLLSVFTLVEPFIAETVKCQITKFQKLILTLMRLRLSAPLKDLAFRFNMFTAAASRIFFAGHPCFVSEDERSYFMA